MKWFLKCYYWYKNRWDELLFLWIVPYIFKKYKLTKLYIEVWDKKFMTDFVDTNKQFLSKYIYKIELIQIWDEWKYNLKKTLKFFGWWEVLTDEIEISEEKENEKDTSKEDKLKYKDISLSHLDELQSPDDLEALVENTKKSSVYSFLEKTLFAWKQFASKYFARAGWNYYVKYYQDIQKWNFVLLWWITKAHKPTTKRLYNLMLPKAKEIICRDGQSYKLALTYNKNTILFDDFGRDFIKTTMNDKKIQKKAFFFGKYVLINVNSKIRNSQTKQKILDFVSEYPKCQKVFFPCDMDDDLQYFDELKQDIEDLVLFKWTDVDVMSTLSMLKWAEAWIGARLHFLLPLQEFWVNFETLVYAEKIQKLIKNYWVFPLEELKKNIKKRVFDAEEFKIYYLNKWEVAWDNEVAPEELIYLISWKAEITILDKVEVVDKPTKVVIPKNTYHKIEALSDIVFLLKVL